MKMTHILARFGGILGQLVGQQLSKLFFQLGEARKVGLGEPAADLSQLSSEAG